MRDATSAQRWPVSWCAAWRWLLLYVIGTGRVSRSSPESIGELPKYGQRIGDIVDGVQQKIQRHGVGHLSHGGADCGSAWRKKSGSASQQETEAAKKGNGRRRRPATHRSRHRRRSQSRLQPIGDYIAAHLSSFYEMLLMASFIPFLVYFMLSWRDHINRSFLQFFHGRGSRGGGAQPGRHCRAWCAPSWWAISCSASCWR